MVRLAALLAVGAPLLAPKIEKEVIVPSLRKVNELTVRTRAVLLVKQTLINNHDNR